LDTPPALAPSVFSIRLPAETLKNDRNKARLIAGYSWEWPTKGRSRGTPVKHVTADGLALPWNYDDGNWAAAHDGIEQVGCIHTSQGLEFDWMGVHRRRPRL